MDMKEVMANYMATMAGIDSEKLFTPEGWQAVCDALAFMPPQARAGFMAQFMLVATQM